MKTKLKNKSIKGNVLCAIILIITGVFLEFKAVIYTLFQGNSLNLNLSEVNTNYDDDEEIAQENTKVNYVSYQEDTTWHLPASSSYYISSTYTSSHPAIDIVPTNGDYNIYAAYSGVIVTNSYKWDGGNYLVLKQDNGYYTLYCHLSEKLVQEGQRVEKGQIIGTMGRTGLATGVHLHYSVWNGYPYQNSSSFDPLNFY